MADAAHTPPSAWPRAVLAGLLILTAVVSLDRALREKFDFHHFYADAAYVWQHGALNPDLDNPDRMLRRQLPFYLPVVPLALAPLAGGGVRIAALLWTGMQVLSLLACWRLLKRWSLPPGAWFGWLLAIPVLFESARFNQLGLPVLALVLAAAAALHRNRETRGGLLLGGAIILKLLPGLFLPWLVLKRRWRAAAACLLGGVVLTVLPCLIVFGPVATGDYFRQWWQHNVAGAPARGMTDPDLREHFIDHRNQSLPAILARATVADHPHPAPWQPLELTPPDARRIALGGLAALALAGAFVLRRPLPPGDPRDALPQETSLVLLGMLVLGPLLRTYYLVWAIPAVLLLAGRAGSGGRGSGAARVGLSLWVLGMAGWASEIARGYGVHWFMLVGLGICVLVSGSGEAAEDDGRVVAAEPE